MFTSFPKPKRMLSGFVCFIVTLVLALGLQRLPAQAQLPPGADTQVIQNLAALPNLPIEQFPAVLLTPEIIEQFAAVGTPLPPEALPGQSMAAADLFRVGNFEPFGLPDASIEGIAKGTGVPLKNLSMGNVGQLLNGISLDKLLKEMPLPNLAELPVTKVPALKSLLVQTVFERLRLDDKLSLESLTRKLPGNLGSLNDLSNLGGLVSQLKASLSPTDLLNGAKLPTALAGFDLSQGLGRLDGVFAPKILDAQLNKYLGKLTVGDLAERFPALGQISLTNLSPQILQGISLKTAVPGLTKMALGEISGIEDLPLSGFGALNVQSLSLSQMPDPMKLAKGVRFALADVALGDGGSGSQEQQRLRVVTGGITSKSKQLTGRRCPGNKCPHFEIADPAHADFNGAAWMDGSTKVPDGFGLLCKPFGCKGPAGNHPFGSGVRVQLRNINQAAGTAQVTLSFAYCKRIPFVGKSCTPWIFPIPSGMPIGIIHEETILPYAPPAQVK